MPQGLHENNATLQESTRGLLVVHNTYDHAKRPTRKDNSISPQSILGKYFNDIEHQNEGSRIVDRALEQLHISGELGHPFHLLFYQHKFFELMQYLVLRAVKGRFYRPAGPVAVAALLPYKEYLKAILDRKEKELNEKLWKGSGGELVTTSNSVFMLEEIEEDLLICFPKYALAYCVSAGFQMTQGVAKQISRKFWERDTLRKWGLWYGR